MEKKKYNKELCIKLLQEKYESLKEQGVLRYPKRSDFEIEQMVAIKAFLGPWPRALEIASIKEPRVVNEEKLLEKKIMKKRRKIESIKKKKEKNKNE